MKLTKEDGKSLISLARESISSAFKHEEAKVREGIKRKFPEKTGAFVTLTIDGELRGCIGFTDSIFPLWEAVARGARAAAFEDPRFFPLTEEESKKVKIEISVLTKPELIDAKPSEYGKRIEIGKHGLIVEKGMFKGLLLPQVFPGYNADWKKALEMTCQKAGLAPDSWKDKECKVFRFSAIIFSEE
jgi:AmmeMemoRadiSam system protein A